MHSISLNLGKSEPTGLSLACGVKSSLSIGLCISPILLPAYIHVHTTLLYCDGCLKTVYGKVPGSCIA